MRIKFADNKIHFCRYSNPQDLQERIKESKSKQWIEFHIEFSGPFSDEDITSLINHLNAQKKLQSLSLINHKQVSEKQIGKLFNEKFTNLANLTNISISNFNDENIADLSIRIIKEGPALTKARLACPDAKLKELLVKSNLTCLQLDGMEYNSEQISLIIESLQKNTNLESLTIRCDYWLYPEQVNNFYKLVSTHPSLKKIVLADFFTLEKGPGLNIGVFNEKSCSFINQLKGLKNLNLCLAPKLNLSTEMANSTLDLVITGLKQQKDLESISIVGPCSSLQALFPVFKTLPHLQHLTITPHDIESSHLYKGVDLCYLIKEIPKLASLTYVTNQNYILDNQVTDFNKFALDRINRAILANPNLVEVNFFLDRKKNPNFQNATSINAFNLIYQKFWLLQNSASPLAAELQQSIGRQLFALCSPLPEPIPSFEEPFIQRFLLIYKTFDKSENLNNKKANSLVNSQNLTIEAIESFIDNNGDTYIKMAFEVAVKHHGNNNQEQLVDSIKSCLDSKWTKPFDYFGLSSVGGWGMSLFGGANRELIKETINSYKPNR